MKYEIKFVDDYYALFVDDSIVTKTIKAKLIFSLNSSINYLEKIGETSEVINELVKVNYPKLTSLVTENANKNNIDISGHRVIFTAYNNAMIADAITVCEYEDEFDPIYVQNLAQLIDVRNHAKAGRYEDMDLVLAIDDLDIEDYECLLYNTIRNNGEMLDKHEIVNSLIEGIKKGCESKKINLVIVTDETILVETAKTLDIPVVDLEGYL